MKKVIGLLAVVVFASSMANAELLKNLKYDGAIEINAIGVNNVDYDNKTDDMQNFVLSRVSVGMNFDLNDDANAQITAVKNNRNYGTASETAVNGALDSFNFEEAYLNLKGVIGLDHKVGRQYYGTAGDIIIYYGPLAMPYDPALTVNALDGWSANWKKDKWTAGAMLAKQAFVNGKVDTNVFGLKAGYALTDKTNLGAYFYQKMTQNITYKLANDNMNVVGVKVGGTCPYTGILYNAEGAMNLGKNTSVATGYAVAGKTTKYQGFAAMANAKYGLALAGHKLDFMGEFAMGSGEKATKNADTKVEAFMAINSDYRPGLIYGGYQNKAGLTNLTTWNLGANWTPANIAKLNVMAKFYDFKPTTKTATYKKIGTEFDFGANWQHSEKTSVMASYAMFTPDKDYTFPAGKSAQTRMGIDFMVKF